MTYHAPPQPPLKEMIARYAIIMRMNRVERCFERFIQPVQTRKRYTRRRRRH